MAFLHKSIIILKTVDMTVENLRSGSSLGRVKNVLIPSSSHPSAPTEVASCCSSEYLDVRQDNGRERAVPLCFNPGLPLPFFSKEQVVVSRMAGVLFNYLFFSLLLKILSCSPLPSLFPEPIATQLLHNWDKIL